MKKFNRVLTVLIFIFLYMPMAVLIIASFNTGKDITEFEGFTLQQYVRLFQDRHLLGLLQDTGIINNILDAVGIGRLKLIRTPAAVVLGMVYNYLPYMILPLYATLVKLDHRLIEAAEDLGCRPVQTFAKVILPLSVPGILSGITMVFVPAVSTFYISQKLGGTDTVLIGDLIERLFKQGDNPNLGAALSLVLMALVFVCTGIMNRFGDDEEGGVIV